MAQTYKNLYPWICAFENLYRAHRQARRGGKRKRPEVAEGGIQDMVGNVYEWCQDWYVSNYYARSPDARNPARPAKGGFRVLRGGGWASKGPAYCRCGSRDGDIPDNWDYDRGFRCARISSS